MNPSPCLTAGPGSGRNIVLLRFLSGSAKCCRECVGREERKVFGGKSFLSSLQHFMFGFGDVQVGDDCGAYCYAFPVFKPDFSNSKAW